MFCNLGTLVDAPVITKDRKTKRVRNFLFDDESWSVRFLVVDVGNWFVRRLVVIPAASSDPPDWEKKAVAVCLTAEELRKSPDVDSERPVSRQQELALQEHFGWPDYASDWPLPSGLVPIQRKFPTRSEDDPHLRRALDLTGYEVWTTDGYFGLLSDFVLERGSWRIHYLIVKMRGWVYSEQLISTHEVRAISWANHRVTLDRTRITA